MPDWSFAEIAPYGAAGFTALGDIWNVLQQQERNQQMARLRAYYTDPNQITARATQFWNWMSPAANAQLNKFLADKAASWNLGGYPGGLAQLTAKAYAPFQLEALKAAMGYGQQAEPFMTPAPRGYGNPFEAYLRVMSAMKGKEAAGATEGWTPPVDLGMDEAFGELAGMGALRQ